LRLESVNVQGEAFNCSEVVKEVFDQSRGKCFLLRLGKERLQTRSGEGLELLLDLHTGEYPPLHSAVPSPTADGATITVSGNLTPAAAETFLVAPGTLTLVALEAVFVQRTDGISLGFKQTCVPSGWTNLTVLSVAAYTQVLQRSVDEAASSTPNFAGRLPEGLSHEVCQGGVRLSASHRPSVADAQRHCRGQGVARVRAAELPRSLLPPRGPRRMCERGGDIFFEPSRREALVQVEERNGTEIEKCQKACDPPCSEWQYK
jgi:hypothetical protein